MIIAFLSLMLFDGWLDGSLNLSTADNKSFQGVVFFVLILLLLVPAHLEIAKFASSKGFNSLPLVSAMISMLLASAVYAHQFYPKFGSLALAVIPVFGLFALIYYYYFQYGISGVLVGVGINCFSIIYLGGLACFALKMRIDFGLWAFLMFVCVVKCSDIGAYTSGKLFGKHKFSPVISPGKTWEGMAGAVVFACLTGFLFAYFCNIMLLWTGILFGVVFAFAGQFGDLAESLLKRDTQTKDSAKSLPGFGGLLDLLDSPLGAAPVAYLFFYFVI
jgi:phosphatidate cytidylyltransferase